MGIDARGPMPGEHARLSVGGAFYSLSYFDLPYNLMVLVVVARQIVEKRLKANTDRAGDDCWASPSRFGAARQERMTRFARYALEALSPGGANGYSRCLIFHRVHQVPDPLFPEDPDAGMFAEMLERLHRWFNIVSLPEALDRLKRQSSCRRVRLRSPSMTAMPTTARSHYRFWNGYGCQRPSS